MKANLCHDLFSQQFTAIPFLKAKLRDWEKTLHFENLWKLYCQDCWIIRAKHMVYQSYARSHLNYGNVIYDWELPIVT